MSHLASFGSNASYKQTSVTMKHRTPESDEPLPVDAQTPRISCHQKVISFKLVFQFLSVWAETEPLRWSPQPWKTFIEREKRLQYNL